MTGRGDGGTALSDRLRVWAGSRMLSRDKLAIKFRQVGERDPPFLVLIEEDNLVPLDSPVLGVDRPAIDVGPPSRDGWSSPSCGEGSNHLGDLSN
jgi:hypothetical protein